MDVKCLCSNFDFFFSSKTSESRTCKHKQWFPYHEFLHTPEGTQEQAHFHAEMRGLGVDQAKGR